MSSAQVGTMLRQIRKLADARHDHEAADHLLLERFANDRDEAAFAALLRRHGSMVLGVCRSVLHDHHDAEDAFQATFLLLAQKAGSIHRQEAVSAWLYRVAYHLAVRAQARAARRRVVEKRAVTMPSADPVLDMSLREVRRVLFEELENLPEQYRTPLVLCGLEEKTVEEAAGLLGWTRWAVKGRLQRGRELLRARLRRRGLELSSGLCAVALAVDTASAQVSTTLADATLRAVAQVAGDGSVAGGAVSAQVAALVQGASKTMFCSKAKIATVLLVALSIVATTLGVAWHRAAADQPPRQTQADRPRNKGDQPLPAAKAKAEGEARVEVRGRVLGPDGKPVAGAKLYLGESSPGGPAPAEQAKSGPDGRFRFTVPRSALEKSPCQVMAVATGHGCDWVAVGPAKAELTLRLVKDVPVRGLILDPDGKAVAAARLRVTGLSAPKGDDLAGYLEAVRKEDYRYAFARDWSGPLPGQPAVLTTGADGRFQLAGVGRERIVRLHVEGPAIATADLEVMTRLAKTVEAGGRRVHGASFDYVAVASRPIRGVVRDKDTRKPLAGVSVGVASLGGYIYYYEPQWMTVTDKEGRYELLGLAKSAIYVLAAKPPKGQLYFQRQAEIRDTAGLAPLTADIDMVQGLTVRGKVTDKATGKPVAHARVQYEPDYRNPHINTKVAGRWSPQSEATTGADGSYALTVLPGPGFLHVTAPKRDEYAPPVVTPREWKEVLKLPLPQSMAAIGANAAWMPFGGHRYNAMVLLNPGPKDKALVKDVALERTRERKGRVLGPDGKPLTGVTVSGLGPGGVVKGAEFIVRGLNPRAPAGWPLIFHHKGKNLGFFLKELPAEKADPFTVQLQPCGSVSGRIVDQDGEPVAEARSSGGVAGRGWIALEVTTDKNGRFHAKGLVPGLGYWILRPKVAATLLVQFKVEPGKHKDLGDIKLNDN
jgi:RNA polymerase sigma factor (sigma-70 family)